LRTEWDHQNGDIMGSDEPISNATGGHSPQLGGVSEQAVPATDGLADREIPPAPQAAAPPDDHSEQWRANASKAGEKIKAMFRS
jgi:hypothetical protein